ncbi:Intraflagellar transport protein 56 [Sorochytrium milnesiophthora]
MILSRAKAAVTATPQQQAATVAEKKSQLPTLASFVNARDYVGAVTLLEFERAAAGQASVDNLLWLGFAAFHLGDYHKAHTVYRELLSRPNPDPMWHLYLAVCQFYLGQYKESDAEASAGPTCSLQNRLQFHLSHKLNDEQRLMGYHQKLHDVAEDQLTLASIHYLRGHYQEAVDIYKRLVVEHKYEAHCDHLALNVYLALCYYKLDFFDVSQEFLELYLQQYPDSVVACNLKACNHFKLYNGKAAEQELKVLLDKLSPSCKFAQDIIKHNLAVFRSGEGSLQTFPPLVDVLPEARLNLAIYYLRNDDVQAAFDLMKDVEPATAPEYILKGIAYATLGQQIESREYIKIAHQYYQLVGGSASECDTIAGRQSMASCFFLLKHFEDVVMYLSSIKTYFFNDDAFNYNYGQAKVATQAYTEAEEALVAVQSEKIKSEFCYLSHLAKCYIMNKKPRAAWELYLKMETSSESFTLLQLIANDCYKTQQYYFSAKAFDVLERLDPTQEYWEGKRGACIGVFQQIYNGQEAREILRDVVNMMRGSTNPQVEYITRVMKKWAKENRVAV